jgi:hypothetical protein
MKGLKGTAPIVPGQKVFGPEQMRLLLGGISRASYFRLRKSGLLRFSRIDRGRQAVHTIEQYEAYLAYLNGEGAVGGKSEIAEFKARKNAAAHR